MTITLTGITSGIHNVAAGIFFITCSILFICLYCLLKQQYNARIEPSENLAKGSNMKYYQAALGQYLLGSCMAHDIEEAVDKLIAATGTDTFTIYEDGRTMVNVENGCAMFDDYNV